MPARVSESFVLRTYPYREADLVVSFFSRDMGKLRGISPAGAPAEEYLRVGSGAAIAGADGLFPEGERPSWSASPGASWWSRSSLLQSDYAVSMALDYFTEVTEQMLPPHEPNERFFRLLAAVACLSARGEWKVTETERASRMWTAVLYVSLWAVRLSGIWPDFRVSGEAAAIAGNIHHADRRACAARWTKATASDLRRLLIRTMEQHTERRFHTVPLLEALYLARAFTPDVHMDTFQQTIFKLKRYWDERGCHHSGAVRRRGGRRYDVPPKHSCACSGPNPYKVAYVQPSRRPADGRYGENPNRLYKHQQLQVILKPWPDDVLDQYLGSLEAIGIDLSKHDIKFEEDNWEVADAGSVGHRLAGDAGWTGDHAVHVFPAMRRHGSGACARRNHLWAGAA